MSTPVACLTVDWAGRIWRIAQQHLDVYSSIDGRYYHYTGGLPTLDLDETVDALSEAGAQEITIEALFPSDVSTLVARGHPLQGATMELAVYTGDWDDREVFLRGFIRDPEYQPGSGWVSIRVSADPGDDAGEYPPTSQVVDIDSTVAGADSFSIGATYPTVINRPGVYRRGAVITTMGGSPAYNIGQSAVGAPDVWFLVAGHWIAARGTGTVRLRDETTGIEDDCSVALGGVIQTYDRYPRGGQRITVLQMSTAGAAGQAPAVGAAWTNGDRMSAIWTDVGGMWNTTETDAMSGAGEVLRWALSLTSLPVDWRRTWGAVSALRDYHLSGYWDQSCSPYQWIRDNLLPILPVSLRWSADGIYPVVWRWWATAADAVAHLEVGRSCAYVSGPQVEGWDDARSQVSVRGARAVGAASTFQLVRTMGGDRADVGTPFFGPSGASPGTGGYSADLEARRAKMVLASAPAAEIEADMVFDAATAALSARQALYGRYATYTTCTIRVPATLKVEAGDVVTLTWSALGMTRRAASIIRRYRRGAAADLTLRITSGGVY